MSLFVYEAINEEGRIVTSEINSASKEEVIATLSQKHLAPVKIELKGSETKVFSGSQAIFESFATLDKIILVRNLAATIKAGLNLTEALEIMATDTNKNVVKKFLAEARQGVSNGQPLSNVFERHRKDFSPIFTGMIRAGESSGTLDKSLEELSGHLNREYNLVKKIKSALAYPVILIVASIGIVAAMLIFVLPKLSKSFAQNNVELPALTKVLVSISSALTFSYWLDIAIVLFLVGFVWYFRRTEVGKKFLSELAFRIPVVRNLIKKIMLVRFARTLGSLISGALSISESLNLTAKAVGNTKYEEAIINADRDIKNGIALSNALKNNPKLFPSFLVSLVAVGEKTGTLDKVLKNFADFYEEDVSNALKDLTTFLEPILLLFMGLMVGLIALSILLPIYQMVGSFNAN
jgi:type II secretory pathway component PulF